MTPSKRFLACCLLLASTGFTMAEAQRKPGDPLPPAKEQGPEPFAETINVNVVNVDVYVTDEQGKAVTGLTRDDFEIYENGKPLAITNFYAETDGRASEPPEPQRAAVPVAPAAAAPAPLPEQGLGSIRTPEDQRLRLVIYIDNFNLLPISRNRVMGELRAFIGQRLDKDDLVMLATYDRELNIRRTFTSDPTLIAQAMKELERVSAQGTHGESEHQDALRKIADSESVTAAEGYARTYAESAYNDLSFSIDGLKELVDALAGTPGRKAIIYVSNGLQMIAGQDVFLAVQNKYGEQSMSQTMTLQFDVSRRLNELTAQANANRITFYTIDAAGLRAYDSGSAANAGSAPAPGMAQIVEGAYISNLQSTLQLMAEQTGGQVILNTNPNMIMPRLERIAKDFNTYYSLGYTPPHYGDGRYYRTEVKVKNRKELQVRHRAGYRDKSTDTRMNDGAVAALSFPFEDNPLGISIEFGQPRPRDDGFFLVPVLVRIPLDKLVLVPREQTEDARVRMFIAAMDSEGRTAPVQQTPVPISIPKADVATVRQRLYVHSVDLLMRGGEQRVAVGVRDDIAAQASFVSRGIRVGHSNR